MKKKYLIICSFFLLFLHSCCKKDKENQQFITIQSQEVKPIKKALIDGFNQFDAELIGNDEKRMNFEKNLFNTYISTLKMENEYYDIVVDGYSVKLLYFDLFSHPFCLVRDNENNYHYFSNSDIYRYSKIFGDTICKRDHVVKLSKSDTLFVYKDVQSVELEYLRNIINRDGRLLSQPRNSMMLERLVFHLYQTVFNCQYKYSIYQISNLLHVRKGDLIKLYKNKEGVDSDNLKNMVLQLDSINCLYGENMVNLKIDNLGIIIICYFKKGNLFEFKKYFIPQLERSYRFKV